MTSPHDPGAKERRGTLKALLITLCVLALPMTAPGREYVHFLWNQHQPTYINAQTGKFEYPFTRLHAMSSYYFMASALIDGRNPENTYEIQNNQWVDTGQPTGYGFPFMHMTINLSGVLIEQIDHYVTNLAPAFDHATTLDEIDLSKYPGGDPRDPNWTDGSTLLEMGIDLMCKPIANWSINDKRWILDNTVYLKPSAQYIEQWPSYNRLVEKRLSAAGGNPAHWTDEELGDLLMWWNLAVMNPYFKETNNFPLRGHDQNGNEMTDVVTRIKDLGQFKTWGAPEEEWFGENGETLDPNDAGGYSGGSGAEYTLDGVTCYHFTDEDRLHVAWMQYKIMKFTLPIHRKVMNTMTPYGWGQLEVTTTPFTHPILPLIFHTDTWMEDLGYFDRVDAIDFAFHGQGEAAPGPYGPNATTIFDDDVYSQVAHGCKIYKDHFGQYPHGMWPGEGSVGESVIYAFQRNGVKWISSGNETGDRSGYHANNGRMYRIDEDGAHLDGDNSDGMSICFRSERDLVGFDGGYFNAGWDADADNKAFGILEGHLRVDWGHPKFWTHTADGENPWGWFHRLGATFLEGTTIPDGNGGSKKSYGLYYRINRASPQMDPALRWYGDVDIIAAHPTMYIGIRDGEYSGDGIQGLDDQFELEPLHHGSWIFGNFDTWMGEENEIQGWYHLKKTREDFELAGLPAARPNPYDEVPDPMVDRDAYFEYRAWHQIYHAESSDYFWWYGTDQCSGSDEIFDNLFRRRLTDAYVFARKAGYDVPYPAMQRRPIFDPADNVNNHHYGGAGADEDYVFDCEPPQGHGDIVPIPPITQDPTISMAMVPADGNTRAKITLKVFEEGFERSVIQTVYADLSQIGGSRRHLLHDDGNAIRSGDVKGGDGIYSAYITVAPGTAEGPKLVTLYAIDDDQPMGVSRDPIMSKDYITVNVQAFNTPVLGMAGYQGSDLSEANGGTLDLRAEFVVGSGGPGTTVGLYYQGIPLGLELDYDTAEDVYNISLPVSGLTPGAFLLEMVATTDDGWVSPTWPYLTVER